MGGCVGGEPFENIKGTGNMILSKFGLQWFTNGMPRPYQMLCDKSFRKNVSKLQANRAT